MHGVDQKSRCTAKCVGVGECALLSVKIFKPYMVTPGSIGCGRGVWEFFLKIYFRKQYLRNDWADFDTLDLVEKLAGHRYTSHQLPGSRSTAYRIL